MTTLTVRMGDIWKREEPNIIGLNKTLMSRAELGLDLETLTETVETGIARMKDGYHGDDADYMFGNLREHLTEMAGHYLQMAAEFRLQIAKVRENHRKLPLYSFGGAVIGAASGIAFSGLATAITYAISKSVIPPPDLYLATWSVGITMGFGLTAIGGLIGLPIGETLHAGLYGTEDNVVKRYETEQQRLNFLALVAFTSD